MSSISRLIIIVSAIVSLLLVAGTYLLFTGFGERMVNQISMQQTRSLARVTFTSMYQLMNQGWNREQVDAFAEKVGRSVVGSPLQIRFYRGELVSRQYGAINQGDMDERVTQAMRTGQEKDVEEVGGVRYLFPMSAATACLSCHTNAKQGDVLGVIDLRAEHGVQVGETRTHLLVVLLLLSPLPLVAGWIIAVILDNRTNRFVEQLDAAIDGAEPGQAPDFNAVQVKFAEFRELLGHFKRLVKA